jgi:hypothetical protein
MRPWIKSLLLNSQCFNSTKQDVHPWLREERGCVLHLSSGSGGWAVSRLQWIWVVYTSTARNNRTLRARNGYFRGSPGEARE